MMALADFHYTTGISSGFKVYILEGHPSFENEQRFQRLPSRRFPVYSIKRKLSTDTRRSPDPILERQKASKMMRHSTCGPVASSREQVAPPAARLPGQPLAVPCLATSDAEPCRDSPALHPSCPDKCPLRKPLLDPASLAASQMQQMRPSVITCAPRRSCPETPPGISPPQTSPLNQKSSTTPDSPRSQRPPAWAPSPAGSSAPLIRESYQKEMIQEADENPFPNH
ncbi:hypothetical protein JRQ81_003723 [Phrynocephalus forsythii]|uniref:Uncharacterized protein n=1 Tax=Phrynocephalus forsythii TaxID=171643 RepID=A0A9Q0XL68_9SAUR|nr:hypothetical protein JRQ81_003723 [Phrynocephalus forsythii]